MRTFDIHHVTTTPSTQDEVWTAAAGGAPEGYVCVAEEQTAGRGRRGRVWIAPAGGALLVSVLLRIPARVAAGVPFVAGLAALDVLDRQSVHGALKWPNDVLVNGRKIAGILVESRTLAGADDMDVVLGLGMNLSIEAFPPGVVATSLHGIIHATPERDRILQDWLETLAARLAPLEAGDLASVLSAWRERAAGLGRAVSVQTAAGTIEGVAEDVDANGALIVRAADAVHHVLAGDVRLARSAPS